MGNADVASELQLTKRGRYTPRAGGNVSGQGRPERRLKPHLSTTLTEWVLTRPIVVFMLVKTNKHGYGSPP